MLQKYENYEFKSKLSVQVSDSIKYDVFDIDYYGMRLNALERFDEGEFVFAKKIKFIRRYV